MDSSARFEALASRKRRLNLISVIIAALVILAIVLWMATSGRSGQPRKRYEGGMYHIGRSVNYQSVVSMTPITTGVVTRGRFSLPLEAVVEHRLVYTEYRSGETRMPVMGYLSSAGRVVITLSHCEPCRSETFRIDGRSKDKHLVCETCGTRWRLNDLKGISGGCVYYPPEEIPYEIDDGMIVIDSSVFDDWTPREYNDSIEM